MLTTLLSRATKNGSFPTFAPVNGVPAGSAGAAAFAFFDACPAERVALVCPRIARTRRTCDAQCGPFTLGSMLSIIPSATTSYQVPMGTIFDEDVSVWALVKYIFKVMFAFIIVNMILTLPVVVIVMLVAARLSGGHIPADFSH